MNTNHQTRLPRRITRCAALAVLPAMLMLGACRDDDAPPLPQVSTSAPEPGTTTTTTVTTVARTTPTPTPAAVPVPAPVPAPQAVPAPVVQHHEPPPVHARAPRPANPELHGHVIGIQPIEETDKPSGAGAVLGGVLGGVLGNQVGGGDGRKLATVAGAVGGAYAGNHVEKSRSKHIVGYRVSVRTDAGGVREFERQNVGDLAVGSAVRIVDGGVRPV